MQHHQQTERRVGRRALFRRRQGGFSLIELMIGITIIAIALAIGMPSMYSWLQSSQIRNAAESINNGLQVAKSEAVRRNTVVQLSLTSMVATGAADWSVTCGTPTTECPGVGMTETEIQKYSAKEGAPAAQVASTQSVIAFNGTGRVTPAATITINVSNPNAGACAAGGGPMRCLRILVSQGGQIRMCDPALPSTNPRGCPP